MIDINPIWIISISLFIASFIGMIILALLASKRIKKFKYSMLSYLPCEIIDSHVEGSIAFKISNYIFAGVSILNIVFVAMNAVHLGTLFWLTMLIAILITLALFVSVSLINIPLFYVKQHIIASTIFMSLSLLVSALTCFYTFYVAYLYSIQSIGSPVHFALGILSGLVTLSMLLVVFNPRLKDWAILEKVTSKDEVFYERPRMFPLAYTEWISLFLLFLASVIYIVSLISF